MKSALTVMLVCSAALAICGCQALPDRVNDAFGVPDGFIDASGHVIDRHNAPVAFWWGYYPNSPYVSRPLWYGKMPGWEKDFYGITEHERGFHGIRNRARSGDYSGRADDYVLVACNEE